MITISKLAELLGWASVLNLGMLVFAGILFIFMKPFITAIHSKLFGISENELLTSYFNYLANYKIFTFVLIVAPYLALKIMGH